jgi:hypothetical protein
MNAKDWAKVMKLLRQPVRKALCSIGAGPHATLLAISEPTFSAYADRHGYQLHLHRETPTPQRPPAWGKVQLIRTLLHDHDIVLWIDADAAVVDQSVDIIQDLHDAPMGMVAHLTEEASFPIPNTGVWVLRRCRLVHGFLNRVWASTEWIDHKWWENAAVLVQLGYELAGDHLTMGSPTRMRRKTSFLPFPWNSIPQCPAQMPRIVHFPGLPLLERQALLTTAVQGIRP